MVLFSYRFFSQTEEILKLSRGKLGQPGLTCYDHSFSNLFFPLSKFQLPPQTSIRLPQNILDEISSPQNARIVFETLL